MAKQRYGNELHPLYSRWLSTTQRCCNPNHNSYNHYGARGITLSNDLEQFEDYKDYVSNLPGYDPENLTLDRIDNNKGYMKGNLRWTDNSTQIANQRSSGKGFNKYTGINWSNTHKRWIARIALKGKSLYSRSFNSELEALNARNQYIKDNNLPHTIQPYNHN